MRGRLSRVAYVAAAAASVAGAVVAAAPARAATPGPEASGRAASGPTVPGVGEPGVGEPGVGEPGVGEPGVGEPGVGEPGVGEPGAGETALVWRPCRSYSDEQIRSVLRSFDLAAFKRQLARRECGTVSVPLDYARPDGRTVRIAVTRYRATDRAHRLGALAVNPGGPGNSGVLLPVEVSLAGSRDLARRFDLIGFDPRGVGDSVPRARSSRRRATPAARCWWSATGSRPTPRCRGWRSSAGRWGVPP
jgi:hypothetical protein